MKQSLSVSELASSPAAASFLAANLPEIIFCTDTWNVQDRVLHMELQPIDYCADGEGWWYMHAKSNHIAPLWTELMYNNTVILLSRASCPVCLSLMFITSQKWKHAWSCSFYSEEVFTLIFTGNRHHILYVALLSCLSWRLFWPVPFLKTFQLSSESSCHLGSDPDNSCESSWP